MNIEVSGKIIETDEEGHLLIWMTGMKMSLRR